ncbi:hypothetical protein ALC56_01468, partial [Trachymyrmex septentrionalis]
LLHLPLELLHFPFDLRHPHFNPGFPQRNSVSDELYRQRGVLGRFPRTTASIPERTFTIGPHYFDPHEIRHEITGQPPRSCIPVFIPPIHI